MNRFSPDRSDATHRQLHFITTLRFVEVASAGASFFEDDVCVLPTSGGVHELDVSVSASFGIAVQLA